MFIFKKKLICQNFKKRLLKMYKFDFLVILKGGYY
jgi:hypothetical protein